MRPVILIITAVLVFACLVAFTLAKANVKALPA
jgi:hypothetical protein